jgi:molecular chaperone DnaK
MLDEIFEAGATQEESDGAVVGIDLGTTNSVVACIQNGEVVVIANEQGHRLHPSVVAFKPNGERVVGLAARLRRIIDPINTIFSAKRIIGQSFRAPAVQEALRHLPYRVEEGQNQESIVVTRAGRFTVPQISSIVLARLKEVAEKHLGQPIKYCVVTVPANFSDGQREATRQAAELAGMEVLRILNEPTAAALAYGQNRKLHQRIAIFDLGGGTFDLTLLAVREDLYEVIATGGDAFLGGDDMDRALANDLAMRCLEQHRVDPRTDAEAMAKLLIASEQIKMKLSKEQVVEGTLNELAYGEGGVALSLKFNVTRQQFESLIAPLVDRAIVKAEEVLAEAGVSADRVDEVLLVGGATRVPLVRERVAQQFGAASKAQINPMEVVAAGAALHGHALFTPAGESQTSVGLLMDVTSHALGIATAGGYAEFIIDKNTPIPAEGTRVFTTANDQQTEVEIRVCQGQERRFDSNVPVGELRLDGLRPARRGDIRVEVSFLIDANGILQVAAKDLETGRDERATLSLIGISDR